MPLVSFDESMRNMVRKNPALGVELLEGAINALLAGEMEDGRILIRQYVSATIGFKKLAEITGKQDKNLMRMLGPDGNPTAKHLFDIIKACAQSGGVSVEARVTEIKPRMAASPARHASL